MDNTLTLIARIHDKGNDIIVQELKSRGHVGLAPSHGDILAVLLFSGEMTKTEIAKKVNRERSTVTTLLKKLEYLGYTKSRVNEADARSTIVSLTEKGKLMKEDFTEISKRIYAVQFNNFSQSELKQFRENLKKCIIIL